MSFAEEDLKVIALWLLAIGFLILAYISWLELSY